MKLTGIVKIRLVDPIINRIAERIVHVLLNDYPSFISEPEGSVGAEPGTKIFPPANTPRNVDDHTFIADIYRVLLGRDPDEDGMRHFSNMLKNASLDRVGLIKEILSSDEYGSRAAGTPREPDREPRGCLRSEAEAVFASFQRYQGAGRQGFITNFLGGVTDVRFVPGVDPLSGIVEGDPIPGNFHGDTLEWVGTLRSVIDARSSKFTIVELGAGWAPWCVIAFLAAKQCGLKRIKVIGVEGDAGHVEFMRETFAANGIDSDVGEAIFGVIGLTDGDALFPKAIDASRVYGGFAAFSDSERAAGAFADFTAHHAPQVEVVERVPCFSLATLLRDYEEVDLIHCDIQGAEANLFASVIELLSAKVRRVVVGTHSFEIDRQLACLFPRNGWDLEGISACLMREEAGKPVIVRDGVQVWRNKHK
ncbi:MAG: DUF4214 domain-containing protein [Verrucomicrobia bacterium]|nr:DUF4214 domain-containing protein [Verrucomicrobiota bacterium]